MVGYATSGNADSGNWKNAMNPTTRIATINSVVATGRRMKRRDGFIPADAPSLGAGGRLGCGLLARLSLGLGLRLALRLRLALGRLLARLPGACPGRLTPVLV